MPSSPPEDPRWLVYGQRAWRALLGFLAPAAVLIGAAVMADSPGSSAITGSEAVQALVAAVVAAAALEVRDSSGMRQIRRERRREIVTAVEGQRPDETHPEAGSSVR